MGRSAVEGCPGDGRPAWRVLLAALAALALLVGGVAAALPPPAAPVAQVAGPTSPLTDPGAPSMEAPPADDVVRGAPLAVVPAPTGPAAGLLPVGGPLVAPHLVASPQTRPPTARLATAAPGQPDSRAPPGSTGT